MGIKGLIIVCLELIVTVCSRACAHLLLHAYVHAYFI